MKPKPTSEPMAPVDALLFRSEQDPEMRPTVTAVYILDGTPAWSDLQLAFERTSRDFTRLRQHVVEPTQGIGSARWVTDPDFDLTYHVRRAQLPEGASLRTLLDAVEPDLMTALDPSRPLWVATLYEGLDAKKSALAIKTSHALSDGLGGIELNYLLFDLEREAEPRPMPPLPLPEDSTPDELAADTLRRLPQTALSTAFGLAGRAAELSRRFLTHPSTVAGDVAGDVSKGLTGSRDYVQSLGRLLNSEARPSPLLARRSHSRRVLSIDLPLGELIAAAKALDGSLNDVFLAGVCGALARYHERLGVRVETLPLAFPISTRKPGAEVGGNHFVGATIAAPIEASDPRTRVQRLRERVHGIRSERALDYADLASPLLAALPSDWTLRIAHALPKFDVQASNVRGAQKDLFLAGARVEKVLGIGPLAGSAMMAVLISHVDSCAITLNYDPASVRDANAFEACLNEAFEELLALSPRGRGPRLPEPPDGDEDDGE